MNTVTGFRYIGCSKNHEARWKEHRRDLSKNNHHSIHLQRAWNKYGKDRFTFNIIQEYKSADAMFLNEVRMIEDSSNLYNIAAGGKGGDYTRNWTEEQRSNYSKLMSKVSKERYKDPKEREKANVFKNLTPEEREKRLLLWSEVKKGKRNGGYKHDRPVQQIDKKTGEVIRIYEDLCEVAEVTGFERRNILNCLKKRKGNLSAKGYKWEWI